MLFDLILLLIVAAAILWALPKLGFPEFVRVIFILLFVAAAIYVVIRGPVLFL